MLSCIYVIEWYQLMAKLITDQTKIWMFVHIILQDSLFSTFRRTHRAICRPPVLTQGASQAVGPSQGNSSVKQIYIYED